MVDQHSLLSFFNQSQYQTYSRPLAKALKSVDAAIIFSELVQRFQMHQENNELTSIPDKGDDWFYHTQEAMEDRLVLGRKTQDRAIEILKKAQLILTMRYGIPCKKYFKINFDGIQEFLNNLSSLSKTDKLDCPKRTNRLDHLGQTAPYIEEPHKELKEREGDKSPAPAPSSKAIVQRKPHVFTTEGEHQVLVNKYGQDKVSKCYEFLSDWKIDTPKAKWKKNDARSIGRWVIDAVDEQEMKAKKKLSTANVSQEEGALIDSNMQWFKSVVASTTHPREEAYNATHEGVTFYNYDNPHAKSEYIYYRNTKFKDLIMHELRKRNYERSR